MTKRDPTSHAADIAEQILAEISAADQDWATIATLAEQLATVASENAAD